MNNIFFWKDWEGGEKWIYSLGFLVYLLSMGLLGYQYVVGDTAYIGWITEIDLDSTTFYLDDVSNNFHVFPAESYAYINFTRFVGDDIKPAITEGNVLMLFTAFSFILILAGTNAFEKYYYYGAVLVIVLFLAGLKFDLLQIINSSNAFFAYTISALLGVSYYFHAFNKSLSFTKRTFIFAALVILLGLIIWKFSSTEIPGFYLLNYGSWGLIIITLIFIMATGTEVIDFILLICTDSDTANRRLGLPQFVLFSLSYLIIIGLILAKNMLVYEVDMYYPQPLYFYPFVALFGIWSFRKRSVLISDAFSFRQGAAFWYLAFGIIANATIGYYIVSGNDPMVEIFEDFILMSQLGFGLVYMIYVIWNFMPLFKLKARIYQLVYQPTRAGYFNVFLFGCMNIILLQFQGNFFNRNQAFAGYNNGLADLYYAEKNMLLAEEYYNYGIGYAYQNHKSNYALGCMARQKMMYKMAKNYFEDATLKNPSEYCYANISDINHKTDRFFESMFSLRDGIRVFPKSPYLHNNMAIVFNKTNVDDSTVYYLGKARMYAGNNLVPKANEVAFFSKNSYKYPDTLSYSEKNPNIVYLSNSFAYKNARREPYFNEFNYAFLKDSILNPATFSYLFNYSFNNIKNLDTTLIKKIEFLSNVSYNQSYSEDFKFLLANAYYYNKRPQEGIKMLQDLSLISPINKGYYLNQIGVWNLDNNLYKNALYYFQLADNQIYKPAREYYAIMLSELGLKEEAIAAFTDMLKSESKELAERKLKILQLENFSDAAAWPDDQKLELVHLRINEMNDTQLKEIVSSVQSNAIEVLIAAEIIAYNNRRGLYEPNVTLYTQLKESTGSSPNSLESGELNYQYLQTLIGLANWQELEKNTGLYLNKNHEKERSYFEAMAAYGVGKYDVALAKFKLMMQQNICIGEGIVTYAKLLERNKAKPEDVYNLILAGLQNNPNSVPVLKAYIMKCLEMNMEYFSEETWDKLKAQVSVSEYNKFALEYLDAKKRKEQQELNQ